MALTAWTPRPRPRLIDLMFVVQIDHTRIVTFDASSFDALTAEIGQSHKHRSRLLRRAKVARDIVAAFVDGWQPAGMSPLGRWLMVT